MASPFNPLNWFTKTHHDNRIRLNERNEQLITRLFGFNVQSDKFTNEASLRDGYASSVDIYSIINKIAVPGSSLKWVIERQTSEGWEVVEDTSLNDLMNNPNPEKGYTWRDFMYQYLTYLLSSGDGFVWGMRPEGMSRITKLDILPSQYLCINTRNSFIDPVVNYSLDFDVMINFEKEEVLHTKFFNPSYTCIEDMVYGLSPIRVAWLVTQVGLDRWKADASLLKNKGAIGILTNRTDMPFPEEHEKELQDKWNKDIGGAHNFGKVKATGKNVDFIQMAMSSTDLQLLQKDVVTLRAACNVYGVPSELLNDPANKTFNNRKEANKELWTNGIQPHLNYIADDLNRWLVPSHFPEGGYRMRPDYSGVEPLQADRKELADLWIALKTAGIQTANQAAVALSDVGAQVNEDANADKLVISQRGATLVENLDDLNEAEIGNAGESEEE